MDELPVQDSCLVAAGEQPRRLPGHSISGGRWPACDLEVGTLSARWLAPDVADGRDVVRMAEVGREPEPVLDRTQQAVVEVHLVVAAGSGKRAEDRADDVAAGAEAVHAGEPSRALILVVGHDDDPVAPEGRRGLDLGYLLGEEVVELGVAVVDRLAGRFAVVAAVRDDHVVVGYLPGGEVGVEGGHPGRGSASGYVVGQAFRRWSGGRPNPRRALDVIKEDRRGCRGVETAGRGPGGCCAHPPRARVGFWGAPFFCYLCVCAMAAG